MALQVWITGTDGMKNLGLGGTRNLGSSTSNANGKIGTCLKITTNYNSNCTLNPNTTDITMCGWFKFNLAELLTALNNSGYNSSRTTPTGNLLGQNSYGGLALCYQTNNLYASSGTINNISVYGAIRDSNSSSTCSALVISFDTWTHVILTWNHVTKLIILYINGVLKSTATNAAITNITTWNFQINTNYVWGGNGPGKSIPLYFNDIRCYDNLLSEDEIHELSLGKVGHWKLNDYEISRSSLTSVTWNLLAPNGFILANVVRDTSITTEEKYIVQTTQTTSARCLFKNGSTISTTHKAFVRVVFKSNFTNAPYLRYQYASGSYNSATTTYVPNKWCKIIKVSDGFALGASTGILPNNNNFIQGEYISIADWIVVDLTQMFGSGNEPTAEQFDKMFPLWGAYPYDSGTVKDLRLPIPDISGLHNNGTTVGTLSTDNNTPRYDKCCVFNSSRIQSNNINLSGNTPFSISCWVKRTGSGNYQPVIWLGNGNTGQGICLHGPGCNRLEGGNGTDRFDNAGFNAITVNTWTHIVLIWNGSTITRYINGSANGAQSYSSGFGSTLTRLYVGYFWGGNFSGNISDVRLYATALSADDVLKLYKLGNV